MGFSDLPPRAIPRPKLKPRRVVTIVVAYALAIGFGVALFTGSIPGLGGHFTTNSNIGGHEYYTDEVYVPTPTFGDRSTSPSSVVFHNVTFWFWLTGWGVWSQTLLHGNGTEANGTSSSFAVGNPSLNDSRTDVFLSPDLRWGAAWGGGWFLTLYVEIPPYANPTG
ncbi:MAG TPA: hypothetical protein VMF04_00480 [Thermoplasmata archaeon]|nr:hypothetical protein [Thermoplasmata archaeon]